MNRVMRLRRIMTGLIFLGMLAATAACPAETLLSGATTYRMSNGMEVILKENHSSPMIASVVMVKSGAKYETDFNNGATHFLEHLLFNGTSRRTQEEIEGRIKNLGGYINAFTRKEVTAYMSLVPTIHIREALDIQQDMLFHSILPAERFPKERGIVIEEIHKDRDNPDYVVEQLHARWAYQGSPYARPVLGYENLIGTIPREEILNYYQTYYQPNNMIMLVIGAFETEEMRDLLDDTFGQNPARPLPPRPAITVPPIHGKTVKYATAAVGETKVNFHMRVPKANSPDYLPILLWSEILGEEAFSPLNRNLTGGDAPLATNVGISLDTQEEFAAFDISVSTDKPENVDAILSTIERSFAELPSLELTAEDVNGIATRMKVEELFLREKLHYYAIMRAPTVVTTGYDFLETLPDKIAEISLAQLRDVASRNLTAADYVATVVTPEPEKAEMAETAEPTMRTMYAQRTLSNGLPVTVKSNPDSRVFAITILGKNRSAIEPAGKEGISAFVNRLLESGTETRDATTISRELSSIGAELTTNDNPYIPYDDFYTTPQYTFIKFATIDEFARDGAELLADMVGHAAFPDEEIEKTRRQVMGILGMSSGSTSATCRSLFYGSLFGDGAYARPIAGTHASVAQFTRDDLLAHRQTLYAPANMVLTCATNLTTDEAFAILEETFGRIAPGTPPTASVSAPITPTGVQTVHEAMDKEQVYITMGGPTPGAANPDAAALMVADQILSTRLKDVLREQKGLAYSVGAGLAFDRDFGWHTCTMGTGKENYAAARDGIIAEVNRIRNEPVTAEELETAQNTIWGTTLTRRLSRVNQAYYMALDEFLGRGYDYHDRLEESVRAVTIADVQRVAQAYFNTQNYILATVGDIE